MTHALRRDVLAYWYHRQGSTVDSSRFFLAIMSSWNHTTRPWFQHLGRLLQNHRYKYCSRNRRERCFGKPVRRSCPETAYVYQIKHHQHLERMKWSESGPDPPAHHCQWRHTVDTGILCFYRVFLHPISYYLYAPLQQSVPR